MSEADKKNEDNDQDNVSRNNRFSYNDNDDGQRTPQRDQGLYHDEDFERVEVGEELEQIQNAVDWIQNMGSVDHNRNEDACQVDSNVVAQEQADSLVLAEEDFWELDMDGMDEMDGVDEVNDESLMWTWINSNPELRELAESYVNGLPLLPRPTEEDVAKFREAFFGRDLMDFLETERQRHLGLATVQNNPGMPSKDMFSTASTTSESDTRRKGMRPRKYKCRICGLLKREIQSGADRPGRPHVCRPTREQIVKEIEYRINKGRKDSLSTTTRPPKRTKLGRSDSAGSDGYMCNKCGERKSGHICQVPDVIGRIAQRIHTAVPGVDIDEKTIQDAVDNEEGFKFSETDGSLIVNAEVPPPQDSDQRPVRWSSQAEEHIRLLQEQRDHQVKQRKLRTLMMHCVLAILTVRCVLRSQCNGQFHCGHSCTKTNDQEQEDQHPPEPEPKEDDAAK